MTGKEIILKDTKKEELSSVYEMEQGEARKFIIPYALQRHNEEIEKRDVIYKSVYTGEKMIGFIILALDSDELSVEFRRIVIAEPNHGYGKQAVPLVDRVCREELDRNRIWLDVFEDNKRAQSVYEKCGYRQFGISDYEGRVLLLYEKNLLKIIDA